MMFKSTFDTFFLYFFQIKKNMLTLAHPSSRTTLNTIEINTFKVVKHDFWYLLMQFKVFQAGLGVDFMLLFFVFYILFLVVAYGICIL